jgi:hypothetical protein
VDLCLAIGSSSNSQHAKAEAADFECVGVDNAELADWIKDNLPYDQLIVEYYTPGEPNSGWIHCSYVSDNLELHIFGHIDQKAKQNTNLSLAKLKI